jgi:hypothetical protein
VDPTAKAVLEAERDPLGRLPVGYAVGYEVDRSDPDVLVLRRSDGSFMTAFSRRGVRSEGVREAVEEELKRGEASGRAPSARSPRTTGARRRGDEPQTRPARAGSAQAAYDEATRIGPTSRREEEAPKPPYWLVARTGSGGTQILTIGDDIGDDTGKVSTLALFGSEEGAMEFRRRHAKESGWLASPIGIGELLSVLCAPRAEVGRVALDPSPEIIAHGATGLVSLSRQRFVDSLLGRGRAWFEDRYHEEGGHG